MIGDADEKSLQERMRILLEEAQEWNRTIGEFHKRLMIGNEQDRPISIQIDDAKNKSIKDKDAIEGALQTSDDMLKGLKVFYERVFGREGGEEVIVGLSQELDKRSKELDDFKSEQQKAYVTLLKEINDLLPGATSAGLASAYRALRDSFDKPIIQYTRIFYGALCALIFVGFLTAVSKIGFWSIEFVDDFTKILGSLLYKLPIIGSLLWLALFASKRRSENQRLQQEYAHKEALAKSYQSFKKQIDDLNEKDELLTRKLLDATIDAVAFNASQTLDGAHGDKIPTQELLEGILNKFPAQNLWEKIIEKILK